MPAFRQSVKKSDQLVGHTLRGLTGCFGSHQKSDFSINKCHQTFGAELSDHCILPPNGQRFGVPERLLDVGQGAGGNRFFPDVLHNPWRAGLSRDEAGDVRAPAGSVGDPVYRADAT